MDSPDSQVHIPMNKVRFIISKPPQKEGITQMAHLGSKTKTSNSNQNRNLQNL